jgi:hypothetical protein
LGDGLCDGGMPPVGDVDGVGDIDELGDVDGVGDIDGVVDIGELGDVDGVDDEDGDMEGVGVAPPIRPGSGFWSLGTAAKPSVFPAPST